MNTLAPRNARPILDIATVLTEALRGITARHVNVTLIFGAFWFVTGMLVEWRYISRFGDWRSVVIDFIDLEAGAMWVLLAVSIADAAIAHGAPRRTAYVAAALAACVVSNSSFAVIDWLGIALLGLPPAAPPNEWATPITMRIYVFTQSLLFIGAAVFLYAQWRAAHLMQEHLRAAEFDRVRKARLALESRLQALQARVEPEFLFKTLSQVRDLYDRDVGLTSVDRASKMLDDLIAYLRAAMPHMRDTASTVAQEVELARAYLDIARLRMDRKLGVDIVVAGTIANARMPPMMLLPLIDDALGAFNTETGNRPTIRVEVRAHGDRLQASVIRSPGGLINNSVASLANIRERLSGLYGASASLEVVAANAGSVEARLALPLEFPTDMNSKGKKGTDPM